MKKHAARLVRLLGLAGVTAAALTTPATGQSPASSPAPWPGSVLDTFPALGQPTTPNPSALGLEALSEEEAVPPMPKARPSPSPSPVPRALLPFRRMASPVERSVFRGPEWTQFFSTTPVLPYSAMGRMVGTHTDKAIGPVRFGLQLDTSAAYNNNVFGTQKNTKGDMIYTVSPGIALRMGDRAVLSLTYQPTLVYYMTYKDQNSVNQNANINLTYRFTKLNVGVAGSYATMRGLYAQSTSISDMRLVRGTAFATYQATKKSAFRIDGGSTYQDTGAGTPSVIDSNITFGYQYQVTRRFSVGPAAGAGFVEGPDYQQTYQRYEIVSIFNDQNRWQARLSAGLEARQYSQEESENDGKMQYFPVFNLLLSYWPSRASGFDFSLYRRAYNETFNADLLSIQTGSSGGFSLMLSPTLRFAVAFSLDYVEALGDGDTVDSSSFWFTGGSATLVWKLHDTISVRFFNNVQKRFASSIGEDYTSNVSGVSLNLNF